MITNTIVFVDNQTIPSLDPRWYQNCLEFAAIDNKTIAVLESNNIKILTIL